MYKAVFGLFGGSEDAELRGVMAALRIRLRVRNGLGLGLQVGVAAGRAFCGAVRGGSKTYTGYTMLGSKGVTLAARLMCKAPQDTVVCSPEVHASTADEIVYENLGESDLKGMGAPIQMMAAVARRLVRNNLSPGGVQGSEDPGVSPLPPWNPLDKLRDDRRACRAVNSDSDGSSSIEGTNSTVDVSDVIISNALNVPAQGRGNTNNLFPRLDADTNRGHTLVDTAATLEDADARPSSPRQVVKNDNEVRQSTEDEGSSAERSREITIRRLIGATLDNVGGKVLLVGEAGMGKSHTVGELCRRASSSGVAVAIGHAASVDSMTPFSAFLGIVNETLCLLGGAAAALRRCGATRTQRSLLRLLASGDASRSFEATSESQRQRLVVDLVVQLINVMPLLLVILEDAQWCDSASWVLIEAVTLRCPRASFVVTSRPDGRREDTMKLAFASLDAVEVMTLTHLSPRESRALLIDRIETKMRDAGLDASFEDNGNDRDRLSVLVRRSAGHPMFLKEIGEWIADDISRRTLRYATASAITIRGHVIPSNIGDVLDNGYDNDIDEDDDDDELQLSCSPSSVKAELESNSLALSVTAFSIKNGMATQERDGLFNSLEEVPFFSRMIVMQMLSLDPAVQDAMRVASAFGDHSFTSELLPKTLEPMTSSRFPTGRTDLADHAHGHTHQCVDDMKRREDDAEADDGCKLQRTSGNDRHDIDDILELMQRCRFIMPSAMTPGRFNFVHDVVRCVVYNTMTGEQHRMVHGRIAEIEEAMSQDEEEHLETVDADEYVDDAEAEADADTHGRVARVDVADVTSTPRLRRRARLAQQWERAGRPEKAFGLFISAGDAASASGSYWDAVNLWTRALRCAEEANMDDVEISFIEVRLAVTFQLKLTEYDMSLRPAASAAKRLKVPIPARITPSMVRLEAAFFIAGAGKLTKYAKPLSKRSNRWREAAVTAWVVIAWAVSGASMRGVNLAAALDGTVPEIKALKGFCLLHSGNLATTVPDTPVYIIATSLLGNTIAAAVPVIGNIGLARAVASMRRQRRSRGGDSSSCRAPNGGGGEDDDDAVLISLDLADGLLKGSLTLQELYKEGVSGDKHKVMSTEATARFMDSNVVLPLSTLQQLNVALLTELPESNRDAFRVEFQKLVELPKTYPAAYGTYGKVRLTLLSTLLDMRMVYHQADDGFEIMLLAKTRKLRRIMSAMDAKSGTEVPIFFRVRCLMYVLRNHLFCSLEATRDDAKFVETAYSLAESIVSEVGKLNVFPFLVHHMIAFTREVVVGLLHVRYMSGGAPKGWDVALRLLRKVCAIGAKVHPWRELCCRLCEALCEEGLGNLVALAQAVRRLRLCHARWVKKTSRGDAAAGEDDALYLALSKFHLARLLGHDAQELEEALDELKSWRAVKQETRIIFLDGAAAGIDSPGIRSDIHLQSCRSSLCGMFCMF